MQSHSASGFLTILAAGLLQGTMLTPMAYLRKWQWENVWLIYATWAYHHFREYARPNIYIMMRGIRNRIILTNLANFAGYAEAA